MTAVNYINMALQIFGCILTLIVYMCLKLSKSPVTVNNKLYIRMLFLNSGVMLFDLFALLFRGNITLSACIAVRASNFMAYTCNVFLLFTFVQFMIETVGSKDKYDKWILNITGGLVCLFMICLLLTQFFPIFYTINENNIYVRANYFWVSQAIGIAGMLACVSLLLRHKKSIEKSEKIALWSYIVLPLCALCMQIYSYGIVFLNLANTLSLIIIFLFMQAMQGERLARQETQQTQDRIKIMLSQIQPHFIYNALNAIRQLCKKDSCAAQNAIDDFAKYLRGNLDLIKCNTPIPFTKELEHIRIYLNLEKMRFEEELQVVWNVEVDSFMLPALTVQPLVENAVKYGVGKKPGGGTVTISTKEIHTSYVVVVEDDGAGYDPTVKEEDGRTHIGIDNVRGRLEAMCRGRLTIETEQGVGTTAAIYIPKDKNAVDQKGLVSN